MSDERDRPDGAADDGAESDGLDAWLAANFPPKTPEPVPPPAEPSVQPPLPPPAQPTPPPVPPLLEPPSATPPGEPPAVPPSWFPGLPASLAPVPEPPVPVSSELPPVFSSTPPASPPHPGAGLAEPPGLPPVADELAGLPLEADVPADPTEVLGFGEASALDDLFGESKFRDYLAEPGPSENPFAVRTVVVNSAPDAPVVAESAGISTVQKALMWVAGALVAVLALFALFLLGTKLSDLLGPAPAIVTTPSNTPTPTATALPLGPLDPGEYRWDELLGGECLDPYNGPWEDEYTVVDCDGPHPAQLATRGVFGPDDGLLTPYPGIEALQSQVNLLCTASTVIDYARANAYTDIQFEASFAATSEEWGSGDRDYYCFLSRPSGGVLEGTIAMPQVAPTPTATPAP